MPATSGSSALSTASPSGASASMISPLAAAIASRRAELPEVGGADVEHDRRRPGGAIAHSVGDVADARATPSPGPGSGSARSACSTVSGRPTSVLNDPAGATVGPSCSSSVAIRSLVVVLPEEPVTATTRASGSGRQRVRGQPAQRRDRVGHDDRRRAGGPRPEGDHRAGRHARPRRSRGRRPGRRRSRRTGLPGATRRESAAAPVTADRRVRRSPRPSRPPRRPPRRCPPAIMTGTPERRAQLVPVVERRHHPGAPPGPARDPCPARARRHRAGRPPPPADRRAPVADSSCTSARCAAATSTHAAP